jgi:sugar/nucleoside kinase (ribokinase family)
MGSSAPDVVDLLVLGDCNPDLILSGGQVEPRFGQVERLVEAAELTVGGSGSIVACGAARLGLSTALMAIVGDDLFGQFMTTALGSRGVDTTQIKVDPVIRTGLTVILDRGDDRAMLTFPGTIATLSSQAIDDARLATARHVHVSSFFMQTDLRPALPELLEHAKASGASTSIDPNWDPSEQWNGGLKALLPSIDVFLPNGEEAMRIAGTPDPKEAARTLAKLGPLVAVKLGRDGAIAAGPDGERVEVAPIPDVEPVDTVGAGDSFDAGFLAGFLNGWSMERALALGCACGALSTRAAGGTAAQPTLEEALASLGDNS